LSDYFDPSVGLWHFQGGYRSLNPDANRYFEQLSLVDELRKQGKPTEALAVALGLLPLVPNLIEECVRAYGKFDITSIPPIETGCILADLFEDPSALREIGKLVDNHEELEPWREVITRGWADLELVRAIRAQLASAPGTLQSGLGKAINRDGRNVARLVKYMNQAGQLRREKEERSYRLYLVT